MYTKSALTFVPKINSIYQHEMYNACEATNVFSKITVIKQKLLEMIILFSTLILWRIIIIIVPKNFLK